MSTYLDFVGVVRAKLNAKGYSLKPSHIAIDGVQTPLEVTFPADVFALPLIAVPDVHLGDHTGADIFANGAFEANSRRLFDFLQVAAFDVMDKEYQGKVEMVQLGDWYDIWRAYPTDLDTASFKHIETPYVNLASLDSDIGLRHYIGNHDAVFARALSTYRSSQPEQFPFGSWLAGGRSVFGMHGHQSDAMRLADAPDHPTAAKTIATISSVVRGAADSAFWRSVEDAYDKGSITDAIKTWAKGFFLGVRPDAHAEIKATGAPGPTAVAWAPSARYAANGAAANLVSVAEMVPSGGQPLRALVVGHSHIPRISWVAREGKDPVVVIDVGSWAYGQSNVLLAAGNAAAVFDVTFGV